MPLLDLSFEWPVDEVGYSLVDHKPEPKSPKEPIRPGFMKPGFAAPIATSLSGSEDPGPSIVRRGGALRTSRPLELHSMLFIEFAKIDDTDESCLRFANSFGYLGFSPDKEAEDHVGPRGESLEMWRHIIANMRDLVKAWQASPDTFASNQEVTITRLDVSLVPIDGRPQLRMRPQTLISAIHLQFAQAVATGLDLRTCGHCGNLFGTGGTGRTRRARFCSDRCRNDYHLAKRRKS